MQFIAHRGESFDAPENTLAAFRLAWDRGCSAIELDIHQTGDGQLVCCHDADTARCCGTRLTVANTSYRELRALDAGAWKAPQYAGERIPLLSEVLDTIPPGGVVFIEVKCGVEAIPELRRCVEASALAPSQVVLISFGADVLRAAARALPGYQTLLLGCIERPDDHFARETICRASGFSGVDLSFAQPVTPQFIRALHDAGLQVYTWTVDDIAIACAQQCAGVNGITSNRAAWLEKMLTRREESRQTCALFELQP